MNNLIIIIAFLLVFLIFYYGYGYGNGYEEQFCNIRDEYKTHALMAPNIPDDPQTKYLIGGKYNKPIQEGNIAPTKGKYVFPIPELMYDGIWKSDSKIDGNIEVQDWKMNNSGCNPKNGYYAANKFLHIPEKKMIPGQEILGEPFYYGDWTKLEMMDRNMYNLDNCDYQKRRDHKRGIVYWPPF